MPSTTLSRGNVLSQIYIAPSITPVAVASYTTAAQTFNIAGLQTTDIVQYVGILCNTLRKFTFTYNCCLRINHGI